MKILIIGSGGREHALAWKAAQSNQVNKVFVAPGNAGTQQEKKVTNIEIGVTDVQRLLTFACQEQIDLTIVGPEAALAVGLVDAFEKAGMKCFGPSQLAAQLETSKIFAKNFLKEHQIPTANYETFTDVTTAKQFLKKQNYPLVIKFDGLAAGKGVVIAEDQKTAETAIEDLLTEPNAAIVIEEFLRGEELSYIVMVDGENLQPLVSSQDHKRRDDGDHGPNTGGMGAYSPAPLLTEELNQKILQQIIKPTLTALKNKNIYYRGFLYAGLMITSEGEPKVLEFNCRLGDPEAQVILMRLQSDLVDVCLAAFNHQLAKIKIAWDPRPALTVVMAAHGYPLQYTKGDVIQGLETESDWVKIFHSGTTIYNGQVVSNGGRVLTVTALGENLLTAKNNAYAQVKKIQWKNAYYRTDIGNRGLNQVDSISLT